MIKPRDMCSETQYIMGCFYAILTFQLKKIMHTDMINRTTQILVSSDISMLDINVLWVQRVIFQGVSRIQKLDTIIQ